MGHGNQGTVGAVLLPTAGDSYKRLAFVVIRKNIRKAKIDNLETAVRGMIMR
jgi:hypothetical protein